MGIFMGFFAKVVAFFSSQAFLGLANGVVSVLNKRSDSAVAINQADVGAGRDVDLAQINANLATMHEQAALATLRWGWWGTRWLMLAAALPPVIHSGMVYLDSCPFWWHDVGSWGVARAPGVYEGQELSIIATVVGVLTVQTIGGGIVSAIIKKK
ncbi:hypothetical protein [Bradyrhizobium betae]|uniref:Uncharacterized protein n=1 Tax=Bradyrhizobium betae TaxID=244734 RepID=A0A5P6NZ14_9BRAD|nr:hypothetical protein [Bradyrhizobium betae]MCS3725517.1 hypothetical protein [Bradyrhizobium betae]QFI71195.1 hypothetical protein F8237_01695 [Bradyrhizobium betae]